MIRRITTPQKRRPSFDQSARADAEGDRQLRREVAPRLRAWLLRSGKRSLGQLDEGGSL